MRTAISALTALAVTAGLGLTAAGTATASPLSFALPATTGVSHSAPPAGANTAEVAAATHAFLRTLSPQQRQAVLFDFDSPLRRSNWTNLPTDVVPRRGLAMGDLDDRQRRAAMAVLRAALSREGYQQVRDAMAADDELTRLQDTGQAITPPYGPPSVYGSGYYHLALFGEPSLRSPFALQFSGHHVAHNLTYSGRSVSMTPEFVGTEPIVFRSGGRRVEPLAAESSSVVAMIDALSEEQRAAAQIPGTFGDVTLGAQKDDQFPQQPQGVRVADLTPRQQRAVTAVLRAWAGDLDKPAADALVARYVSQYDRTYVAWSGRIALDELGTYVRVDGPGAWIEFATTRGIVTGKVHFHSVYRDEEADYGDR
jgi:hypothetical protein